MMIEWGHLDREILTSHKHHVNVCVCKQYYFMPLTEFKLTFCPFAWYQNIFWKETTVTALMI